MKQRLLGHRRRQAGRSVSWPGGTLIDGRLDIAEADFREPESMSMSTLECKNQKKNKMTAGK